MQDISVYLTQQALGSALIIIPSSSLRRSDHREPVDHQRSILEDPPQPPPPPDIALGSYHTA
ncbi:MAG TPA: hypothetical protein VGZ25_05540 [Gemmataceae bacterium]|nr:hypothetical protein [Gemmataceae bacterium]